MFRGNWDGMTVHKNIFERRIRARFVRINPMAWRLLGQMCMRVEIYLCQVYLGTFFTNSNPVPARSGVRKFKMAAAECSFDYHVLKLGHI